MDKSLVLPSCTTREVTESVFHDGHTYVPYFCGSCGTMGGHVIRAKRNFAFWLCNGCEGKWAPMVGIMMVPDEVVWAQMRHEQVDEQGILLPANEIEELFRDGNSPLNKLLRDLPSHD